MNTRNCAVNYGGLIPLLLLSAMLLAGCSTGGPMAVGEFARRRAEVNPAGLAPSQMVNAVKANCAAPQGWDRLGLQKTLLFSHQQWRSPTHRTAVGVIYIRMPLPFSGETLINMAKNEYSKKSSDGKLLGVWSDALGRHWCDAQNNRYRMRAYAVTQGFDAWIAYWGYRTNEPMEAAEVELARKSLETILPGAAAAAAPVSAVAAPTTAPAVKVAAAK